MANAQDTHTILTCTAEYHPFAQIGGLGDAVGGITEELARLGHRVLVFLPRYRSVDAEQLRGFEPVHQVRLPMAGDSLTGTIWRGRRTASSVLVYLVQQDALFDRDGIYNDPTTGQAYADNARRFIFFCRAVVETLRGLKLRPDIVHAHDHQTALVVAYLKTIYSEDAHLRDVASLFTIHNLGYQGIHDRESLDLTGLPPDVFHSMSPFEFWGKVNFMKAGIRFADLVSTVSARYAQEVTWSEEFGFGLEGVLRDRQVDLVGIQNGIDTVTWDPSIDPHLVTRFSADDLAAKARSKADLVDRFGLAPGRPLIGMVSRLVDEKGIDLLLESESELFARDLSLVILGTGEGRYEGELRALRERRGECFAAVIGHDEELAHRIIGGADFLLKPSRHEPCGRSQIYALRYGTIPIVREVGGLADSVTNFEPPAGNGNGFTFTGFTVGELVDAVDRAIAAWGDPKVRRLLQTRGMATDGSWAEAVAGYVDAYDQARESKKRRNIGSWSGGAVEHR